MAFLFESSFGITFYLDTYNYLQYIVAHFKVRHVIPTSASFYLCTVTGREFVQ